ncbi:glycoside hydrolase family 10 /Carbohydrate-binding module family 1 [Cryphonectria parasitica EP155]|uniref:Beta-xylanase n=1 Tax=Cryphonectria parasitica (strain ATCC 38755 / EP155) TaxID=660469 RepID=A0A9P5CQY1_CRYP1|nr:glycoside hydrolase family 10 /Carbohydrate-binding module family 1 [Cryphonectria parasitica EP155]KAF3766952.1 glycoside hydrolase family 10 /Carbohydrate-binding module family 1 [Cryphonectria parasitica EP155]
MSKFASLVAGALCLSRANANLNQLAQSAGKLYFGSATDNGELSDSAYVAILSNYEEFGQITPGNTQKWEYTEPTEGDFTYTEGDVITDFAEANGQILRCHNLVWYNQLPSWVTSDTWTNETLTAVVQAHIESEVGHYKGQCYAWDVVNEALDDNDPTGYRTDVFYETMGVWYIPLAFATAAATDPDAKLYYNDYNIEYAGNKATAAVELVQMVQAYGAKIDGVGLQGHFIVGETPSESTLLAQIETFAALGVEVAYTEVDVRFTSLPPTTAGLAQQATDYGSVTSACLASDACVGITVWDFDDAYSWIPSTFSGEGDACLYWANLTTKPAYDTVESLLASAAGTTVAATSTATATVTVGTTSTTTGASATATQTQYGQCGGDGYTGPTVCASPYTCEYFSEYYSQCL